MAAFDCFDHKKGGFHLKNFKSRSPYPHLLYSIPKWLSSHFFSYKQQIQIFDNYQILSILVFEICTAVCSLDTSDLETKIT